MIYLDRVRADLLEAAIMQGTEAMFRDEQFMARIWAEAKKRLGTEKPILEKEIGEIGKVEAQAAMDRYFEAFEAGTLTPELCNEKVRDLRARLEELEAEKRALEARRGRLELPAVDREMLNAWAETFERTMRDGTNPQRKDAIQRVVERVNVCDRRTVDVWYLLPNTQRFADWNKWLPGCTSMRTRRRGPGEPEVWFRIVHRALEARNGDHVAAYREQTVEIALGPKGAFENGNVGTLTRRVPADRVVSAVPPRRGKPKPLKEPRTPRVVELLRRAIEWQALLESGEASNQADIARREGITPARVTQVMGLLRLAPEIQEHVLSLPDMVRRPAITERALRPIVRIDPKEQRAAFSALLDIGSP